MIGEMTRRQLVPSADSDADAAPAVATPGPATDTAASPAGDAVSGPPSAAILFNEKSAPQQVVDIIDQKHAFVGYEGWETVDEQGRPAWLLLIWCETASEVEILELVGGRLPDYIRARRFPPSQVARVRRDGTQMA